MNMFHYLCIRFKHKKLGAHLLGSCNTSMLSDYYAFYKLNIFHID